jgi:hypothetical protein
MMLLDSQLMPFTFAILFYLLQVHTPTPTMLPSGLWGPEDYTSVS